MTKNYSLASFFSEVKKQKEKLGQDVIELNVGDPQVKTPLNIRRAGIKAIENGDTHYISPLGEAPLREVIAKKYFQAKSGNVIVSSGARMILSGIFGSLLNLGDKVFIPAPYYPSFLSLVNFFGGQSIILDTSRDNFNLTAEIVEKRIKQEGVPKFLIINSPNNPTGKIYSKKDLKEIVEISRHYGFNIIFDECYHHFSSEQIDFTKICPESIVVNSCSKTYAMTGWRVGWVVAPIGVIDNMSDFFKIIAGSGCSVSQKAALEALINDKRIDDFSVSKKLVLDWLNDMEIPCSDPDGSFYVFPDFSRFMNNRIKNSFDLAVYLLKEAQVGVAPGQFFGNYPNHLRLAYCLNSCNLEKGLKALKKSLLKNT